MACEGNIFSQINKSRSEKLGRTWKQRQCREVKGVRVYLRNCTEIEDALVAQARQIGDNVRHVSQSVGDEQVETRQSRLDLLWPGQVLQAVCKLTPGL